MLVRIFLSDFLKQIRVFDFAFIRFLLFLRFSYIFFVILQCVYNPQFLVSLSSFLHEVEKYDNLSFLSNFKENERFLFLSDGLEKEVAEKFGKLSRQLHATL